VAECIFRVNFDVQTLDRVFGLTEVFTLDIDGYGSIAKTVEEWLGGGIGGGGVAIDLL
jgi:hypothetical protein